MGFTRWRSSSLSLLLLASARAAFTPRDNRTRAHDADGRRAAAVQIVAGTVFDALYAFNLHIKKVLLIAKIIEHLICSNPVPAPIFYMCALLSNHPTRARRSRRSLPQTPDRLLHFAHYLLVAKSVDIIFPDQDRART